MTDFVRGDYVLTDDRERVNLAWVSRWLTEEAYWAVGRSGDVVARSIEGSLPFSVFAGDEQVAFSRVVTDGATFAWICDVFVAEEHRGRGLGTWMVDTIVATLSERGLQRFLLATKDAQEVYRKSGFAELQGAHRFMEIDRRPNRAFILGTA
ncbi:MULTISPECIES: GNAT family N-acetyltransferase [Actinoplanes]|uniref:GNAT family N-acetyltransferase n=1 Tax=Actinoplanes TaxID=1865 RepID=UPI0005F2C45F|nr:MULTISPECIES: GNAT family N-acetyltransferase [Actinoplanes]GLY00743.1 N-acetyltransferase [Actinoplanes sp. NBRC 101535]